MSSDDCFFNLQDPAQGIVRELAPGTFGGPREMLRTLFAPASLAQPSSTYSAHREKNTDFRKSDLQAEILSGSSAKWSLSCLMREVMTPSVELLDAYPGSLCQVKATKMMVSRGGIEPPTRGFSVASRVA